MYGFSYALAFTGVFCACNFQSMKLTLNVKTAAAVQHILLSTTDFFFYGFTEEWHRVRNKLGATDPDSKHQPGLRG